FSTAGQRLEREAGVAGAPSPFFDFGWDFGCAGFGCAGNDGFDASLGVALADGASLRPEAFRSQMMRKPSRVSKSSTCLIYFDPVPIMEPRPPVAITGVSRPNSASRSSRMPSTSPRYP